MSCRRCAETKPLEGFDRRSTDGRRHRLCKACRREYQRLRWQCAQPVASRSKRILGNAATFTCTRCHRDLPGEAFPPRAAGSLFLHSWCRECFATFNRASYLADRERQVARIHANQRRQKAINRQMLRDYFALHPCVDCHETDPDVLEFDHLRDKRYDVSFMVQTGRSVPAILAEIEKCEVRCANCHRRVTRARKRAASAELRSDRETDQPVP